MLYVTSKQLIPARQSCEVHYFATIIFNLILFYMDLSPHNIQRITEWIHAELDYNFLTPGYSNAFKNKQVLLENQELKQICAICNHVPRYPLFYKCGDLTCLPCLREYKRIRFTFKLIIFCPTCRQDCFMYEIYTFKWKK